MYETVQKALDDPIIQYKKLDRIVNIKNFLSENIKDLELSNNDQENNLNSEQLENNKDSKKKKKSERKRQTLYQDYPHLKEKFNLLLKDIRAELLPHTIVIENNQEKFSVENVIRYLDNKNTPF